MSQTIEALKTIGFNWEKNTIGIKFENGFWSVNVVLINEDGSKKPCWGFLKYESCDEAVEARNALAA